MNRYELKTFQSGEVLSQSVAAQWLAVLDPAARGSGFFSVALSGGRIARSLFSAAAQSLIGQKRSLTGVHFFWGDERCVPPDEPESNFAAARQLLFEPLKLSDDQIHRIHGENPPETAAMEASQELCRLAPGNGAGQPILDLIFLGMGEDGHVASLFPGEPEEVMSSPEVFRAVLAAKPPPRRITMGYGALAAARRVWVLAAGPGKENALRQSLRETGATPLARLLRLRNHTTIFTDIPTSHAQRPK